MIWEFPEADPHWPLHLQPQWQQFMFGPSILVAPILAAGAATVDVYFPRGSWYELWSGLNYSDASTLGRWQKIEAVPYQIPSYIRGGSILPTLVKGLFLSPFFFLDIRLVFEKGQKSSTTGCPNKFWTITWHLDLENSSKSVYALPLQISL